MKALAWRPPHTILGSTGSLVNIWITWSLSVVILIQRDILLVGVRQHHFLDVAFKSFLFCKKLRLKKKWHKCHLHYHNQKFPFLQMQTIYTQLLFPFKAVELLYSQSVAADWSWSTATLRQNSFWCHVLFVRCRFHTTPAHWMRWGEPVCQQSLV